MEDLFDEHLVSPLGLKGTFFTAPTTNNATAHAVVPRNATAAGWNAELGVFTPAGGNFASTNDMAKIGRAILNSSLLPSAITRRWLKPSSFINDPYQALGRPWEIYRVEALGRTIDVYTKAGDWAVYHTLIALIPDYQVGFTVLTAADSEAQGSDVRNALPEKLAKTVIEAVDAVAKEQARENFEGTYCSRADNSSVTFTITEGGSALHLTGWVNNGTDLYGTAFGAGEVDFRILPNGLYGDVSRMGFTGLYSPPKQSGGWFGACANWASVDQIEYGNVPLGQFVFEVDVAGKAVGVVSEGMRVRMERDES